MYGITIFLPFCLQTGRIYHSLEILRTVDVTDPELELVLVTCCAPSNINNNPKYLDASVALLTSVYLQPPTTNWTLANGKWEFIKRGLN